MRRQALIAPALLSVLALAACGGSTSNSGNSGSASSPSSSNSNSGGSVPSAAPCASGSATASGSTALLPLVQKASQLYAAKCPGGTINVSGGGSSTGLANVASGTSDIGDSDVPASQARTIDASTITDHQVAIVVFAVVVNPKTNVTGLTTQQVQDIFSGKVTSWKSVGGADVPVTLIERKPGSGTRLSFDLDMMKGTPESNNPASTQDSTQLVLQGVAGAPGGVSYMSAASVDPTVTAVTIDGTKPDGDGVKSGKYAFFSHEHMYTKGGGTPLANSFIAYILSDTFQTGQLSALGFLPLSTTTLQSAADK